MIYIKKTLSQKLLTLRIDVAQFERITEDAKAANVSRSVFVRNVLLAFYDVTNPTISTALRDQITINLRRKKKRLLRKY